MAKHLLGLIVAVSACRRDDPTSEQTSTKSTGQVAVYCSIDESIARPILDIYRNQSGVEILATFDSEAGKTTGLVNKIISEARAGRPRADIFWSGELFNTILLARQDLLEPYESPAAADIPSNFKDSRHRWTAYALRGRVLAFDPKTTPPSKVPTHWKQLADVEIAKHVAVANPMFGTTRGHVAAMFALNGEVEGRRWLSGLRDGGAFIADGNSATVRAVLEGRTQFAVTDTDDVWSANGAGASLECSYPDLGDGGTLWIPCSVSIVGGAPHPEAARKLVDFLLSCQVERMLAESISRNVPVRESLRRELSIELPSMSGIAYDSIADAMDPAAQATREILFR